MSSPCPRRRVVVVIMLFERRLNACHVGTPLELQGVEIVAEGNLKDPAESFWVSRREFGIGGSEQVEEGCELLGPGLSQKIDERPRFRVEVAAVSVSEATVADQGVERSRKGQRSPVGKPQVVGSSEPRPAAAANHFEIARRVLRAARAEKRLDRRRAHSR